METRFELSPFLDRIASEQVAPAGGSAAAVVGAIGASLAEMAAIHTVQNENTDRRTRLVEAKRVLATERSLLEGLSVADSWVVESGFGGSSTDLSGHLQKRLVAVPLAIAEVCLDVLSESRELVPIVTQNVAQDLRTAITLVSGALQAALQTARYNLGLFEGGAERLSTRVADVAESAETATK